MRPLPVVKDLRFVQLLPRLVLGEFLVLVYSCAKPVIVSDGRHRIEQHRQRRMVRMLEPP